MFFGRFVPIVVIFTWLAVAADDDRISSGIKLSDTAAGEFSTGVLKSGASNSSVGTIPGSKRTLKRVKTMFYAGTEVCFNGTVVVLGFFLSSSCSGTFNSC